MVDPRHLVVVGAGLAGLRAVEGARASGFQGSITLVGGEFVPPYNRSPHSQSSIDPGATPRGTRFRTAGQLVREPGLALLLGRRASGLDFAARKLLLDSGERLPYDRLVLATGADPVCLDGSDLSGVTTLRTPADARALRQALDTGPRVVVVGAGLIGSEVASAARGRSLSVTMVDPDSEPMRRSVGSAAGRVCALLHERAGVDLRSSNDVEVVAGHRGRVTGVTLTDGTSVAADLVVVDMGTLPATGWLERSGLMVHPGDRGIICGADLRTSLPDVWACGDVAHVPWSSLGGRLLRVEQMTNAAQQGFVAGRNAVSNGPPLTFNGKPSFWSTWYGRRIRFVGSPHCDETVCVGDPVPGHVILYRCDDVLGGVFSVDPADHILELEQLVGCPNSWTTALARVEARAPMPMPMPSNGEV